LLKFNLLNKELKIFKAPLNNAHCN